MAQALCSFLAKSVLLKNLGSNAVLGHYPFRFHCWNSENKDPIKERFFRQEFQMISRMLEDKDPLRGSFLSF